MKNRWAVALAMAAATLCVDRATAAFQAGAAVIDVTPQKFPVLVNGGMFSRSVSEVKTPVSARSLALSDGKTTIAIVVVDSCMMPRPLLDDAKELASRETGIPKDHILISATHTHTAPSSMGCLGTDEDLDYSALLRMKLVEAVVAAKAKLQPARVGWTVFDGSEYTALRRWIRRPDRIDEDPFGNKTVRANMHAGRNWDDVTGESGPKDPDFSMICVQTAQGKPLAVLANFSMHYFGDQQISADYFGLFSNGLKERVAKDSPEFVGMLSHGCSGDIWRRDYTKPAPPQDHTIDSFTQGLLDLAEKAYASVKYRDDVDLAMAEARLHLNYRVPDKQRLEWAQRIVAEMGDRLPKTTTEVYAREQVILHERQSTEVVLQALRIGDIAIATTPTETYALTGLKIKLQSPLKQTMVFDLANGGDGYIPPPEQHLLGGYNTWAARSAGLEVQAEPKFVETALQLLEQVSGKPRTVYRQTAGPATSAVLKNNPLAYWRLDEFAGPTAVDSSSSTLDAAFEPAVVYFLEGPKSDLFCQDGEMNRAAHFAGGRLRARLPSVRDEYVVSLWTWNGMPTDARPISGWFFSRDREFRLSPDGDHLGVGGGENAGKLVFLHGDDDAKKNLVVGRTEIPRWTWAHVVLRRTKDKVQVYLNGDLNPEIDVDCPSSVPQSFDKFFFGGRSDNQSNWEGRLDEIAVFERLSNDAIPTLSGKQ